MEALKVIGNMSRSQEFLHSVSNIHLNSDRKYPPIIKFHVVGYSLESWILSWTSKYLLLWKPKDNYSVQNDPILTQMNPIHPFMLYILRSIYYPPFYHSHPSTSKDKNAWRNTSTPPICRCPTPRLFESIPAAFKCFLRVYFSLHVWYLIVVQAPKTL